MLSLVGGLGLLLVGASSFTADPSSGMLGLLCAGALRRCSWSCIAPLLGSEPIDALDPVLLLGVRVRSYWIYSRGKCTVSNEIMRARAQILTENIQKWGSASSIVTSAEPQTLGQLRERL